MESIKSLSNGYKSIIYTLSVLLFSCNGDVYKYWELSKFRLDKNALKDGEEIKILYTSRGPDYNKDLKYYIHIVAVSQETGDTVNILTFSDNGFKMEDGDKVFNYFDENNHITKIGHSLEKIDSIEHVDDIEKIQNPKINKVARDPRYDDIADNNYPTVIGTIGIMTNTQNN
jgi:hypothetical protein